MSDRPSQSAPCEGEGVVGILGGMGPAATVDLLQRIIEATPAADDRDHIRVLIDNNPKVPSRIEALIEGKGESPAPALTAMARGLHAQGADFLAIACNTAHHYHAAIAAAVPLPVLDVVAIAARELSVGAGAPRRVGILASTALQLVDLYGPRFGEAGLVPLYPEGARQEELMALIRAVKAGAGTDAAAFSAAAEDVSSQGADVLLIACTELSVLSGALEAERPVFDAAQLLAEAIVHEARVGRR